MIMAVSYIRIGKNIAAERNKAGMTQEVLAEHLGLSTSHLSNIERAQRKANLSMLVAICTVLDISLEDKHSPNAKEKHGEMMFVMLSAITTIIPPCQIKSMLVLS